MRQYKIAAEPALPGTYPLEHVIHIGLDKIKLSIPTSVLNSDQLASLEPGFQDLKSRDARSRSSKGKAFKTRLSVPISGRFVQIECSPNRANYPYAFTAEWNPNHLLVAGEKALSELGSVFRTLLGHDARRVLARSLVSRVDVNVDFDINILDGTLVSASGKRGGANVMCDFDGQASLRTLYIGVLGSDRRLSAYDKAAERLHSELKNQAPQLLEALGAPDRFNMAVKKLKEHAAEEVRWRLEVRCEKKGGVPVSQITELASCFEGVRLLHLPDERRPFNDSKGKLFVNLARHVGIQTALHSLTKDDRRMFNRAIGKLEDVEYWNVDQLKSCIAIAIGSLSTILGPDAPLIGIQHGALASVRPFAVRSIVATKSVTTPSRKLI